MNEGKREFNVPNTIIRHAQMSEGPDLLLVHLLEPHLYGEEYVETMLEVFEYLGVKKYSLVGAMYDMVPHTRPLIVSGVGVGSSIDEENQRMNVKTSNYEGPTTITYLIGQGAAKKGMDTRIYVVHLPQYFQVEEDLSGTARLVEILCRQYNLPDRLIESDRGKDQYQSLQKMFEEESEVSNLLQRLEEKYDKDNQESEISLGPLSQDIEEFLKSFDEGLSS